MYFLVLLRCAHEVHADDDNEKCITTAKMFLQTNRTQAAKIGLNLQIVRARDQSRLPCEFVAYPFSSSGGIHRKSGFCPW